MSTQIKQINVSVVLALPDTQQVISLRVPNNCTARQAVQHACDAGLKQSKLVDARQAPLGVFGERVDDNAVLNDGDRVEIYRPLHQDPMERRRQRAALEPGRFSKRRK